MLNILATFWRSFLSSFYFIDALKLKQNLKNWMDLSWLSCTTKCTYKMYVWKRLSSTLLIYNLLFYLGWTSHYSSCFHFFKQIPIHLTWVCVGRVTREKVVVGGCSRGNLLGKCNWVGWAVRLWSRCLIGCICGPSVILCFGVFCFGYLICLFCYFIFFFMGAVIWFAHMIQFC